MAGSDALDRVRAGLAEAVAVLGVLGDLPARASVAAVERGARYAREVGADLLIAIGGGATLDTAKCVRLLLAGGGALRDYQGGTMPTVPLLPLVALPTSAGSGSEVTPFAVIRDEAAQINLTFSHPALAPNLAILDPELTRALPPSLTAASGMGALTHAIEAFVSKQNNLITDSLALQTIDTISSDSSRA